MQYSNHPAHQTTAVSRMVLLFCQLCAAKKARGRPVAAPFVPNRQWFPKAILSRHNSRMTNWRQSVCCQACVVRDHARYSCQKYRLGSARNDVSAVACTELVPCRRDALKEDLSRGISSSGAPGHAMAVALLRLL